MPVGSCMKARWYSDALFATCARARSQGSRGGDRLAVDSYRLSPRGIACGREAPAGGRRLTASRHSFTNERQAPPLRPRTRSRLRTRPHLAQRRPTSRCDWALRQPRVREARERTTSMRQCPRCRYVRHRLSTLRWPGSPRPCCSARPRRPFHRRPCLTLPGQTGRLSCAESPPGSAR